MGVSGRAVCLVSGGIDSPVAAYRAMKRGLRCEFVHFSGRPFTGPESIYKAYAQVAQLDRFQGGSRLHVVPFGNVQRELATAGAARLQVIAQRRLMMRTASALAEREGAEALVTGDSLGQVSSQTLRNLTVVEDASTLPVLRPLVAWDKPEIVREAQDIGPTRSPTCPPRTAARSSRARSRIRGRADQLVKLERRLDLDETVAALLEAAEIVRPRRDSPSVQPTLQSDYVGNIAR